MRDLIKGDAPEEGEDWGDIIKDVETIIMPGVSPQLLEKMLNTLILMVYINELCMKVTHWQSPHMHAYFPALNSYPSLLGDMLANGINCLGFTWVGTRKLAKIPIFIVILASDFPISIDLSTISIGSGIYRYYYHIRRHVTISISIVIELVHISKLLFLENLTILAINRSNKGQNYPIFQEFCLLGNIYICNLTKSSICS